MISEWFSLSLVIVLIAILVFIFIKIAVRLRKYGGSMTTTMFASTYEFLNKDKREAVEEMVDLKANKKLEEGSKSKPVE